MVAARCPVCGKTMARLARHMRVKHQLITNAHEPDTLPEFLKMLLSIGLTPDEWKLLHEKHAAIKQFIATGVNLPPLIFATFFQVFQSYKQTSAPKIIIQDSPYNYVTTVAQNDKKSIRRDKGRSRDGGSDCAIIA